MSININNSGNMSGNVFSTGDGAVINVAGADSALPWSRLAKELELLRANPEFRDLAEAAEEAGRAVEQKDESKIRSFAAKLRKYSVDYLRELSLTALAALVVQAAMP